MVLLRGSGRKAAVLLGRRARAARFLPGIFAFPGGALEPGDLDHSGFHETAPLARAGVDQRTRRHVLAFARAALRETHEETGLLLGTAKADLPAGISAAAPWAQYRAAGLKPAFAAMQLVARAITPTHSPRRFHTRFFTADGDLARGRLAGNGELEELAWVPLAEALRLPMAEVGTLVLRQAVAQRASPTARPTALFHWRGRGSTPAFAAPPAREPS